MPSSDLPESSGDGATVTDDPAPTAKLPVRNMTLTDIISGMKRRNGANPMPSSVHRSAERRRKRRRAAAGLPEEDPPPTPPRAATPPPQELEPAQDQVVAPQMTLDADGNIVIDQDSLVVSADTTGAVQEDRRTVTVENYGLGNRITSATYGKRESAHKWREQETDKFYEALRTFGTDFSLMERSFPNRSRRQLKLKFKREEKENPERVDETLNAPPLPMPRVQTSITAPEGSQVTDGDGIASAEGQERQEQGGDAAEGGGKEGDRMEGGRVADADGQERQYQGGDAAESGGGKGDRMEEDGVADTDGRKGQEQGADAAEVGGEGGGQDKGGGEGGVQDKGGREKDVQDRVGGEKDVQDRVGGEKDGQDKGGEKDGQDKGGEKVAQDNGGGEKGGQKESSGVRGGQREGGVEGESQKGGGGEGSGAEEGGPAS